MFRGGVPASQHAPMRAPFQEGDFPAPVEVRLPQRRRGRRRARRRWSAGRCSAWLPAPDPVRGAGDGRDARARRRARGAGGAGRHGGDRGQRPVGRGAAGRRPDRGGRGRDGGLLRRRAARPRSRAHGSSWSTSTRPGPASPAALGVGFAAPADAAGDCDLVVHASATGAGLARSLELLGRRGRGDRAELVRRPPGHACRSARSFHSRRLAIRGSQVGTVAPARRGRRSYADRLALALRPARRPGVRRVDHRRDAGSRTCRQVMPRLAAGEPSALCVRVTYDEA